MGQVLAGHDALGHAANALGTARVTAAVLAAIGICEEAVRGLHGAEVHGADLIVKGRTADVQGTEFDLVHEGHSFLIGESNIARGVAQRKAPAGAGEERKEQQDGRAEDHFGDAGQHFGS